MEKQGRKTIILPIDQSDYATIIHHEKRYRDYLDDCIEHYPELFPNSIKEGYSLIGWRQLGQKLAVNRRRIRVHVRGYEDYTIHPCFVFPYMKGNTVELSKGLLLRKYNLPYSIIAQSFGKDAMFWYRLEQSLAHNSIVGTTIKNVDNFPKHLIVDEHHSKWSGQKIYICTTVGNHCFLGANIALSAKYEAFRAAYCFFKKEALNCLPNYNPLTINIDGYSSTRKTINNLFPQAVPLTCFLHGFIKIRTQATKRFDDYSQIIFDKVWHAYRAENKLSFAQRMGHLKQWTLRTVPKSEFKNAILKLCKKKVNI